MSTPARDEQHRDEPVVDVVALAELRAQLDKRMVDRYGEKWQDLPVGRDELRRREQQGP